MFGQLSERLTAIGDKLSGAARISDKDLDDALRQLRITLLEADVALPVVRQLLQDLREKALGEEVAKSLRPGQVIVKILHDLLVELLGHETRPLDLSAIPTVILLCGLQGAGKTTTAGKLAKMLSAQGKKVALTSVDATRPAAREQLSILAEQVNVPYINTQGSDAAAMAKQALEEARSEGLHILILDTAGRQVVNDALMQEIAAVEASVQAAERLLVLDAMTGQTAVEVAEQFHKSVRLSGCILTKTDADARGGAAMSVAKVTGVPIRFAGTGEKIDAFELFDPVRMAGRILGKGDVVGLVEKMQQNVDVQSTERLALQAKKGSFNLNDFADYLDQLQKMGGLGEVAKMLPGMRLPQEALSGMDNKPIRRLQAIVYSMTTKERRRPTLINGSRKRRIALGSGTTVQEVNRMLKQFNQMQKMMKKMRGSRGNRVAASLASRLGLMPNMWKK
ncbi:MAG: signal recognition particle protein [Mariprofundales bacterium]